MGSAADVNSSGFIEAKTELSIAFVWGFHHDSSFLPYRRPNVCGFLAND
jgi:hypothetical protein